ncbi:Dalr anticodon-binding domain-containing protein 3-like [Plakobranchus ocellatus]|uniref:Dalr anticodon-binding domain-containing protein 3-like n=1 Tax=Plakobranchus ocellatus TaxID=259542 RepID=A0AAV4B5Q9_9GAST|nr:Dalr anticodon-binding domain-containing protein 3-like [Plakobranchus ocellatus]
MESTSTIQMLLKSIREAIFNGLDLLNLDSISKKSARNLVVKKKVRHLHQGDIVVPPGCSKLNPTLHEELMTIMKEFCASDETLAASVSCDNYSLLSFHIDRPKMCNLVLNEIATRGTRYGFHDVSSGKMVSVHTIKLRRKSSLMDMRLAVVKGHTAKLLEANGYTVMCDELETDEFEESKKTSSEGSPEEAEKETSSSLDPSSKNTSPSRQFYFSKILSVLSNEVTATSNVSVCSASESSEQSGQLKRTKTFPANFVCKDGENVSLDLQEVIESKNLQRGKEGYDTNLRFVDVIQAKKPTQVLEESLRILDKISSYPQIEHHFMHIVPHGAAFTGQQIILILDSLVETDLSQSQMVIGPITVQEASSSSPLSAQDFYKSRISQFQEASEMRSAIGSEGCSNDDVKTLTDASIKIDILGNACSSPLSLENTASGRGAESRLGAFILYNAARLFTLLQRFDQAVIDGKYPPLPPVDQIDWTLLREEEDWELVYVYLAAFPDVVSQAVECVCPEKGKLSAKIHTHKVTNFLVSFCKCLSAHYSRYHILTDGEAHLLPLMYARLHMMKAAHQVLLNSFHLIGIKALSYV